MDFNEKLLNNSKVNNFINRQININNNSFFSKESNKVSHNIRLSESMNEGNEDQKNKDLRCINCYLIPFLSLNTATHSININCNFGHSKNLSIEEYLQKGYDNNFSNLNCNKCKIQILKNEKNFVYCKECSELLCQDCIQKHNSIYADNHHMINLDKFDTTCILHNETYDCFCLDCKKNICQFCSNEFHKEHKLIDLDDIHFKRKEIKKIKENCGLEKTFYFNISNIFMDLINKLKDEFDKTLKNIKNEIKFKESIINTYETKVDNYNAIINMKNLLFNTKPFSIDNNLTALENINNLMKYLIIKEEKVNSSKNEPTKKLVSKNKLKKKKNSKNKDISEPNDESKNPTKPYRKSNTVYRKSFISKKITYTASNVNKNSFKNNTVNTISKLPTYNNLNIVNKNFTGDKSFNNSSNNNIRAFYSEIPPKTNENNHSNVISFIKSNKEEDNSRHYNIKNINSTNNSSNNLNYVIPHPQTIKVSFKSNRNAQLRKNEDKFLKNNIKNNSQSQNKQMIKRDDPFSLIKQFNNQLFDSSEKEKIKNPKNENKYSSKAKKPKLVNKKNNKNLNNVNIKVKNKNLKDEDDGKYSSEEAEEEDENDEGSENEEEYEENENNGVFNKKNKNKKLIKKEKSPKYKSEQTKSDKKLINLDISNGKNEHENNIDDDNIRKSNEKMNNNNENRMENNEEIDNSFRHRKIYPKSNLFIKNANNISELFENKKNLENMKSNNNSNKKAKEDSKKKFKLIRDKNVSVFKPESNNLKIKESNNTVCCILEVKENTFAIGFLLGEIDIYDVNYLNCLFTIIEHKARISNMFLLQDKSILTSSFDYTMKKIKINSNNSHVVEFVFYASRNYIYKGIELINSDIISISFKGNINIFKKQKTNYYTNYKEHEIANEEIYNVIELTPNKELAFSTDECLRFFSIDTYQNIGNVHLLEFAKGNNMIHVNKKILAVLLKHEIGLVNIEERQCISKYSLGSLGKPECICLLKDNTILVGISNNKYENIQFLFKQYFVKSNKLKLISEKMEEFHKKKKDDYCRITSLVELKNRIVVYGTAGFEEYKLVGNISIID